MHFLLAVYKRPQSVRVLDRTYTQTFPVYLLEENRKKTRIKFVYPVVIYNLKEQSA